MSFLLSFFSFFSILSVNVEWINYNLTIELNENIEEYRELPEAHLYINGVLTEDPLMNYQRTGVERTFFSVVNTRHVKTFIIKYRVYFPSYNVVHTQEIIFNIVDNTAPLIHRVPNLKIPVDKKLPNLETGLIYSDNYNDIEQLIVNIDHSQVVLHQVGLHPIIYSVADLSGNTTTKTVYLEIFDHLAPKIELRKAIIISYQEQFIWSEFLKITDNVDLLPQVIVDDSRVDYSTLGTYLIIVRVIDASGLSTTVNLDLTIIDNEKPNLVVISYRLQIDVFNVLSAEQMKAYIVDVSDNYNKLTTLDVTITHDVLFDTLGKYTIYFSVKDCSGNETTAKINVDVGDQEKPKIIINQPLIFDVLEPPPFLTDYIDYFDNYNDKEELELKISESINMNEIGRYQVIIEVTDSSNNKAFLIAYVKIVDKIEPVITQINNLIITDFKEVDLAIYFEAEDNYDAPQLLVFTINDQNVEYTATGDYIVIVTVCDLSSNCATIEAQLVVIDIIEPVIVLMKNAIFLEVFSDPIDLLALLEEATDNYDNLDISNVVIIEEIDYLSVGVYLVEYILTDLSLNETRATLSVTIDDYTVPLITAFPLTLYANEHFDPLLGVEITDNLHEYTVEVFPKTLDTTIPGVKVVTYVVTDTRGNYTILQREVSVKPREEEIDIKAHMPVIVITVIGAVAIIYFYKKMS